MANYVRLVMTSNEDWVVLAGKDERRFTVLKPVQETSSREERFVVQRPVYETVMRDASYDQIRNITETAEREEHD